MQSPWGKTLTHQIFLHTLLSKARSYDWICPKYDCMCPKYDSNNMSSIVFNMGLAQPGILVQFLMKLVTFE